MKYYVSINILIWFLQIKSLWMNIFLNYWLIDFISKVFNPDLSRQRQVSRFVDVIISDEEEISHVDFFCIYFSSKIPAIFFLKTLRRDFWLCLHLELFDVNYFVPIKSCLDKSKFWLLFETSLNHSTPLPIDKITQSLNRNEVNGIFY